MLELGIMIAQLMGIMGVWVHIWHSVLVIDIGDLKNTRISFSFSAVEFAVSSFLLLIPKP